MGIVELERWGEWLAAVDEGGGLLLLNPESLALEIRTTREGLTGNQATSLAIDGRGQLWVGSLGGGIVRLDPALQTRAITGLLSLNVQALGAEGEVVYYGTPSGAGRIVRGLPERVFTEQDGLISDDVRVIAAYEERAWFGTPRGVSEFSRAENRIITRNQGLQSNGLAVADLLAGAPGVFAASSVQGVLRFDDSSQSWQPYGVGGFASVRALSFDASAILALGDDGVVRRVVDAQSPWESVSSSPPDLRAADLALGVDDRLWVAGARVSEGLIRGDPLSAFWREGLGTPIEVRGLFGVNCRGLSIDRAGGAWVGTFPVFDGVTHVRADGSIVPYNRSQETSPPGWQPGVKIAALESEIGDVWVSSFTYGVTRLRPSPQDDPATGEYLHLEGGASPLRTRRVLRIAEDPAGRIWFASDGANAVDDLNLGIDVLLDPDRPTDDDSWLKITPTSSLLGGGGVLGISFEGRDVAWISVNDVGLQRWDFDGSTGSGNIESGSLLDPNHWDTLTRMPAEVGPVILDPRGIVVDPRGYYWLATGTDGVFRFDYAPGIGAFDVARVRETGFGPSLLSNQVRSIELDRSGGLWVASDAGLNRVRIDGDDLQIDAWTDFNAFQTRELGQRYLPEIISPLPGSNMFTLAYDPQADRLFMATQTGAASLDLPGLQAGASESLEVRLYPNPVRTDDAAMYLRGFEGTVDVQVYNLLGVLLHEASGIAADDPAWDTLDVRGSPVASGLYMVRIRQNGRSAIRTLAVER
jgi:ligand-binding sensor domain-containing protein